MDRLTRKELKSDKFALEVEHTVDYVSEHRQQVILYGAIVAAIVVIAGGIYLYRNHTRAVRQEELHVALRIQDASVGPSQTPGNTSMLSFPTEQAKQQALVKAFTNLAVQDSGTEEGTIATYYLGTNAADKGNLADAAKYLGEAANSSYSNYASMAKLALARIYAGQGKLADGEKLIRSVIDHPTDFVSKEDATIALARLLAPTRPEEARKLLEPLRTARSSISRAALSALAGLAQPK
ncbi:MAG: tetratricopeptide repeat protein [Bryobacteraceae bacterium]